MYLKKIYRAQDADGVQELDYLALAHTGAHPEQNFSTQLVTEMLLKELMEIKGERLIFHVHPESLRYEIKRTPGRYCLHCGEKLEGDEGGEMARLHIAMKHAGAAPPKGNPAGYERIHHFECVLNEAQHKKFKAKPGAAVQFARKEN